MLEPQSSHSSDLQSHRNITNTVEVYDDGYLRVEHCHYCITCGGANIKLGRAEFLIVSILARNANRFITGEAIWNHVWEGTKPFNQESLKVLIYNLRRQFISFGITFETMIKVGYKLVPYQNKRSKES